VKPRRPRHGYPGRRIGITTREQMRNLRRDLVHTACELTIVPDCCCTSLYSDPAGAIEILVECENGQREIDWLRSGIVRIPRSLRTRWRDELDRETEAPGAVAVRWVA
jgi:hypothetical protein